MLHLGLGYIGLGIGAGLCMIGAGFGIGRLSSSALEGAARQPEAAQSLQMLMIIPAAMIEGAVLLALVIFFLAGNTLNKAVAKAGGEPAVIEAPVGH